MKVDDRLLVCIINNKIDFDIIRDQNWYRIPVESVEKFLKKTWPPNYLAFYQTSVFGNNSFSVNYFSRILKIEIKSRSELFPIEPINVKSNKRYYKIILEPLQSLPKPILSKRWRRIVFIPTTLNKFIHASEINDLYHGSYLEDKLWEEFKKQQIQVERQELVQVKNNFYFLDFAAYCLKGKIDIETDGDKWHHNPEKAIQDNLRNNDLSSDGWSTIRFSSTQIKEQLDSYCIPHIKKQINNFGGLLEDSYFLKRFTDMQKDFQFDVFDL